MGANERGYSWSGLGLSWSSPKRSWAALRRSLSDLGSSCEVLGDLVTSWGGLGALLGPSWRVWGAILGSDLTNCCFSIRYSMFSDHICFSNNIVFEAISEPNIGQLRAPRASQEPPQSGSRAVLADLEPILVAPHSPAGLVRTPRRPPFTLPSRTSDVAPERFLLPPQRALLRSKRDKATHDRPRRP